MTVGLRYCGPKEIEQRSMEIIQAEMEARGQLARGWTSQELLVVKRCIHTSADFDYGDHLLFSPGAAVKGIEALKRGACIVTDTNMAASGINKTVLERLGGRVYCFMAQEDVAQEARQRGITRSAVCMERGASLEGEIIVAVGNAPTALIRLYELILDGSVKPALIIGAPVGFVNVVESKKLIASLELPHIVAEGRKGGSNIAAAICNALLYQI